MQKFLRETEERALRHKPFSPISKVILYATNLAIFKALTAVVSPKRACRQIRHKLLLIKKHPWIVPKFLPEDEERSFVRLEFSPLSKNLGYNFVHHFHPHF